MITNRKLVALVDPATNQYQIDWERSGLVSGMMPATFTIAEDNKTYDLTGQTGPLMEILQILKANNIGMNNMIDLRSKPAARAAGAGRGAPRRRRPPSRPLPHRREPPPRALTWRRRWHLSRLPRNACRSWRPCVPPGRSPTPNTPPSGSRSFRSCNQFGHLIGVV